MRRSLFSLLIGSVLVVGGLAPAAANAADFSVFASYWDTDDFDEAVGAGFRVAFLEGLQVELGATYYDEFGNDFSLDIFDDPGVGNVTLDAQVIPVDAGVRFNFADNGGFFLAGGGTVYLLDSDVADLDDEFGFYARAGFQGAHFFVEGGWRMVEGSFDNLSFDDIDTNQTVDLNFDGLFANLGWRF